MPLVTFRVTFGILLLYSTLRFGLNGWVDELYINPRFYFPFVNGVEPVSAQLIYCLYVLMVISALFITLGFLFKISAVSFLLLFTYFELLDKTYYLNHYYLVCLLSFCLAFTFANRYLSIDAWLWPKLQKTQVPAWQINIFKVQLSVVYFFAGLAKVNPDWLFSAQPLSTWLPGRYQIPVIGSWLHLKWVAFAFSWMGCLYDLSIWIFLWVKKTRGLAYVAVILFHVLTYILFPRIGMFPFIMMVSTLLFFSSSWHEKKVIRPLKWLLGLFGISKPPKEAAFTVKTQYYSRRKHLAVGYLIGLYFLIQLYLPLRYLQYPGDLFWNERGYRFSWRVMLMEKSGFTRIVVEDPKTKQHLEVDQDNYLSAFQKKEMSTQPDMILQFVHFIGDEFKSRNGYDPKIYVHSRVSLNGRRSQPFIDERVDAYALQDAFENEQWVLPMIK